MKKLLLVVLAVSFGLGLYAQKPQINEKILQSAVKQARPQIATEPIGSQTNYFPPAVMSPGFAASPNAVSILDLGQGGNALGFSGGGRTAIWADNNVNAVAFFHRMANGGAYGNSRIAFDMSTNGGASWSNNILAYEPLGPPLPGASYPQAAGRYPQGVLYNPNGNTASGSAYAHYFVPTLDGSNPGTSTTPGSWGGYGYGVRKLDTVLPATRSNATSVGGFLRNVPDAMTIAGDRSYVVEPSLFGGLANNYADSLLLSSGVWNTTTNDFDYTWSKVYAPVDKYPIDTRIAFAPDGQTGYISMLAHNSALPIEDSTYYPILYKTTDAGATWTGPISVVMYGTNGIDGVKNYVTDSILALIYAAPVPGRDSIPYTTAFDHDLVVDMNGNPHIGVVVSIGGGAWDILSAYAGVFDLYSPDGGTTWKGYFMDTVSNFRGSFGTGATVISEDNRVQISRTQTGSRVFVSWLDSENPATDNTQPNIYVRGINFSNQTATPKFNVTKFTVAYTQAFNGSQSHFVFGTSGDYTIPFVYQAMNPADATAAVDYKYIHNFIIKDAQFVNPLDAPVVYTPSFEISQNYPNPCHGTTIVGVELPKSATVGVEVSNLIGQKVISVPAKTYVAGIHEISLDLNGLNAGVYFYTVNVGKEKITKKMIVR